MSRELKRILKIVICNSLFYPEDGGSIFLRSIGVCTASYPRRPQAYSWCGHIHSAVFNLFLQLSLY